MEMLPEWYHFIIPGFFSVIAVSLILPKSILSKLYAIEWQNILMGSILFILLSIPLGIAIDSGLLSIKKVVLSHQPILEYQYTNDEFILYQYGSDNLINAVNASYRSMVFYRCLSFAFYLLAVIVLIRVIIGLCKKRNNWYLIFIPFFLFVMAILVSIQYPIRKTAHENFRYKIMKTLDADVKERKGVLPSYIEK